MLVFVCVVFTVINVCGFAQFIGLNIEIITSICLILSPGKNLLHFIPYFLQFIAVCLNIIKLLFFSFPGLALDYAAHIGVMYACLKDGTRKQKMRITLGLVD